MKALLTLLLFTATCCTHVDANDLHTQPTRGYSIRSAVTSLLDAGTALNTVLKKHDPLRFPMAEARRNKHHKRCSGTKCKESYKKKLEELQVAQFESIRRQKEKKEMRQQYAQKNREWVEGVYNSVFQMQTSMSYFDIIGYGYCVFAYIVSGSFCACWR